MTELSTNSSLNDLMMSSVIMLSMQMIQLYILSERDKASDLSQQLELASELESDLRELNQVKSKSKYFFT